MIIEVIKGDITTSNTIAIVNAANSSLLGGSGVDGAIHKKGGPGILEECIAIRNKQGGCAIGEAVLTSGGKLPASFVIHTVGPVWNGGKNNEEVLLYNCYINSLKLADNNNIRSVAFPNISTGIYHFPKEKAAAIVVKAIKDYSKTTTGIERLVFVCFDNENFELNIKILPVSKTLYRPVNSAELQLIKENNWKKFPPRLPEQPIFYPVDNEAYAVQITREWNVPAYGESYVVAFELPAEFLSKYPLQNVGGVQHNEYWIPAEELEEMNDNIIGSIRLIGSYKE